MCCLLSEEVILPAIYVSAGVTDCDKGMSVCSYKSIDMHELSERGATFGCFIWILIPLSSCLIEYVTGWPGHNRSNAEFVCKS
jgi:hypothetical protein